MRRNHLPDRSAPYDNQAAEATDITQQFWGTTRGWEGRDPTGPIAAPESEPTGAFRAVRDGFAAFRPRRDHDTGRIARTGRTRQHGVVAAHRDDRPDPRSTPLPAAREATISELGAGRSARIDPFEASPPVDPALAPIAHRDPRRFDSGHPGVDRRDARRDVTSSHSATSTQAASAPRRWDRLATDRHGDWHDEYQPDEDQFDDLLPLTPVEPLTARLGLGAVDPLLLRFGVAVLVAVLLVPFALALRPAGEEALGTASAAAPVIAALGPDVAPRAPAQEGAAAAVPAASAPSAPVPDAGSGSASASVDASTPATVAPAATPQATVSEPAEVGDVPQAAPAAGAGSEAAVVDAATVEEEAARLVPECPLTYTAGAGDSWYRIADAAGVSPSAVMGENRATVDTVILPGDEICLPAGATVPTRPVETTAPATTAPPTTEQPRSTTTVPATTAPPTTAPTTAAERTPERISASDAKQIVRDVWPDELEERALEIVERESRFVNTAYNGWCCYGLFQVHWTAHRGWLDDYGVDSATDLLDARTNAEIAYAIYQRAGGWGPWGF